MLIIEKTPMLLEQVKRRNYVKLNNNLFIIIIILYIFLDKIEVQLIGKLISPYCVQLH